MNQRGKQRNSGLTERLRGKTTFNLSLCLQWGEQVFDTLTILQVFPLTNHVEVYTFFSLQLTESIFFNVSYVGYK